VYFIIFERSDAGIYRVIPRAIGSRRESVFQNFRVKNRFAGRGRGGGGKKITHAAPPIRERQQPIALLLLLLLLQCCCCYCCCWSICETSGVNLHSRKSSALGGTGLKP